MAMLYIYMELLIQKETNIISIPVRGRIKETARVDNLVIHPDDWWITSYPPVIRVDN